MDPLRGTLKRIRRRLALIQWISFQVTALLYAAIAACVWLVAARAMPFLGDPVPVAASFLSLSVLAAAIAAWVRRPSELAAALAADERLGLDERLTSSLQLEGADGPMVEAVHADARACIGHIRVGRDFPLTGPATLRWLAVPIFVFGIGYVLLPELDLFGYRERQAQALAEEKARVEKAEIIKEAFEPLERIDNAKAIDGLVAEIMGDMEALSDGLAKGEITERQAMARVLSRSEQLAAEQEKLAESGMAPKLSADPESFGMAAEMAEALAKGDFEETAKAAEELMEKLKSDALSPDEKKELAENLQKLAQNLEGGNPALAQALADLAASAQMGEGQKGANGEQMAKAMEQLQLSVDDLKSIAEQMKQMQMAGECMSGACEGMGLKPGGRPGLGGNWQQGQGMASNGGMGKKGQGKGGQIGDLPDVQTGLTPDMLPGDMNNGPVLATVTQLMPPDEAGESTVTYLEGAIVQGQAEAERALSQEEIPAGAKEFVRQYFGTMDQEGAPAEGTVQ